MRKAKPVAALQAEITWGPITPDRSNLSRPNSSNTDQSCWMHPVLQPDDDWASIRPDLAEYA